MIWGSLLRSVVRVFIDPCDQSFHPGQYVLSLVYYHGHPPILSILSHLLSPGGLVAYRSDLNRIGLQPLPLISALRGRRVSLNSLPSDDLGVSQDHVDLDAQENWNINGPALHLRNCFRCCRLHRLPCTAQPTAKHWNWLSESSSNRQETRVGCTGQAHCLLTLLFELTIPPLTSWIA
jgi:hypothetical protein